MTEQPPWLMDLQTVADLLAVSLRWARYAADGGRLPGVVRIGPRCVRVRRDVLAAWVAAGCPEVQRTATDGNEGNPAGGSGGGPESVDDAAVDDFTTLTRDADDGTKTDDKTDGTGGGFGTSSAGCVSTAGTMAARTAPGFASTSAAVPAGVRSRRSGSGAGRKRR